MGMKERTRSKEKEKTKEEPVEVEQLIEGTETEQEVTESKSIHSPKVTVETSTTEVSDASVDVEIEGVEEFLPSWGTPEESEWMYGIPPRDEDKVLWAGEWADFLLQWTEHYLVHVLSVATFIAEPPFKYLRNKVDSFKMIAQVLIDKEIAEWIDRRKRQLRIYWKPLEDWADIIYAWALKTGKVRLDVKSIVIQESEEDFAKLPEKDLYTILALMVEKRLAEWVDKNKGAVIIST